MPATELLNPLQSRIEIEVCPQNIFADQKLELMIVLPRPQSLRRTRIRKFQRVTERQRRHEFRLMVKSVLKSNRVIARSCLSRKSYKPIVAQRFHVPSQLQI